MKINPILRTAFSTIRNHYEVLNLTMEASFEAIKEKYIQKSKIYHPDSSTGDKNKFLQIQ